MDDKNTEHVSMFVKVKTFLKNKSDELAATPIIDTTLKPALDTMIENILEEDEDASATISGNTELKDELKQKLMDEGFKIAAAATAYYTITSPNPPLRAKCDYERSDFDKMRDSDLYVKLSRVHEIADNIKANLEPFGVTADEVDELAISLGDFFGELEGPRDAIGERAASGRQVSRLIDRTREFLNEQLDVVMKHYATTNPELYDYYKNARNIDNTGGGPVPDESADITIPSGAYESIKVEDAVNFNSRLRIKNPALSGSLLHVGFSTSSDEITGTIHSIPVESELDNLVMNLGFTPGVPFLVFHNPGQPDQVGITVKMKLYY